MQTLRVFGSGCIARSAIRPAGRCRTSGRCRGSSGSGGRGGTVTRTRSTDRSPHCGGPPGRRSVRANTRSWRARRIISIRSGSNHHCRSWKTAGQPGGPSRAAEPCDGGRDARGPHRTVQRLARSGRLPCDRDARGRYWFRSDHLALYLRARRPSRTAARPGSHMCRPEVFRVVYERLRIAGLR